MTSKVYKTAMGKIVDLGSLILQNETVKAVGNMGVNARGDVVDGADKVIDQKNRQVQRQVNRTVKTNVQEQPVHASARQAKASKKSEDRKVSETVLLQDSPVAVAPTAPAPATALSTPAPVEQPLTGLAAAIAKTNTKS